MVKKYCNHEENNLGWAAMRGKGVITNASHTKNVFNMI